MAEGARLERVWAGNRLVGSNPTLSANDPGFCCIFWSQNIRSHIPPCASFSDAYLKIAQTKGALSMRPAGDKWLETRMDIA